MLGQGLSTVVGPIGGSILYTLYDFSLTFYV